MTEPKQVPRPQQRRRYPGARPFSDSPEDQQIFFGRDADTDRLYERVIGTRLLVLFGKSGLGKTSLLMAGLFPKLRRQKPLLPVPIRVNTAAPPVEIVVAAVTQACRRAGAELTSGDTAGVWEFLRSSLIWSGDLLLTPVLVFDQFEEIFTLRDSAFRIALASELGALASGIPPARLHAVEGRRSERGARLGEQPPEVKIVLSLREEYLGTLQELSAQIPGLFQERFRLEPLGEDDARLAICRPAERVASPEEVPFETPSFAYDPDALQELLAFLQGTSRVIEPFQLQLLCCRAEEIVSTRAREVAAAAAKPTSGPDVSPADDSGETKPVFRISRADLGGPAGMEGVLGQFYEHVLGKLGRIDRRRARRLCEEGLINAMGSRIMLDQTQVESDYRVTGPALKTLVDERLLRCEQRLESLFYEISHDRLAKSIERSRPFRIPRKYRHMLWGAAAVAVVTIGGQYYWNYKIGQARDAADSARTEAERLVGVLIGERLLEKLRPVGRNELLEEVQKEVQAYLDRVPARDQPGPGQKRIRGLALRNAGDILRSQGKIDQAIAKFRESSEEFERLGATAPADRAMKSEQARSLERLGNSLLEGQGKVTQSLEAHRKALALREKVFDAGNRGIEATIALADSNSAVGSVLNSMGKPRQAIEYLDRARTLLRSIDVSPSRSPQLLKALHNEFDTRAQSLVYLGDKQGASEAYGQAYKVTEEWIAYYPLSADARILQVVANSRLANEKMTQGAPSQALERYEQMHREIAELTRWDETNAIWKRELAATLILKAEGHAAVNQDDKVMASYDAAMEILTDLVRADASDASLASDLSWAYLSRGQLALKKKQWDQAVKDFTIAERHIAAAAGTDDANAARNRIWATVHYRLAEAHGGDGWPPQAVDLLRRGRAMLERLIETAPEMSVLFEDLTTFYEQEVRALERSGRTAEATAVAREKKEKVAAALAARPDVPMLLFQSYIDDFRIGFRAEATRRPDEALAAYRRGTTKIARAAELEPKNVLWWNILRDAHEITAKLLEKRKDGVAAAEVAWRAAAEAGMRAAQLDNSAAYADRASLAWFDLGRFYERTGSFDKALSAYEVASRDAELAAKADPGNGLYFQRISEARRRLGLLRDTSGSAEKARADYELAVTAGQRAVELSPGDGRNWSVLYRAQWFLAANIEGAGDKAGALKLLRDALKNAERAAELMPEDQEAKKALSDLQAWIETRLR